ncbi:lasso peptide biosynthesis B2 protein [Sphingopyxis indica]|uniref:lasso peptide biosynthesis B2 protein n=1 Tax=Sphingopyxis indica TaxID=436663 RepID=UPI002938E7F6|nr:lasso peptide biosynthesis B2 protein [Sphingopyxis indica]WOF44540.1 lasso peptide biosynthesis B2 protein [Sphingopyxis indica]
MSKLRLRHDLLHCAIGADAVCLDLSQNRYFLFAREGAAALRAAADGSANETQLEWLAQKGFIEVGEIENSKAAAAIPVESVYDDRFPRVSAALVLESLFWHSRARRWLATQSLGALLSPNGLPYGDVERYREIAASFARASRYRDTTDQCLARGLAMRAMLARRNLGCNLVVGVTLPFAAHCWIQVDGLVISDPLDLVLNYRPLHSVR